MHDPVEWLTCMRMTDDFVLPTETRVHLPAHDDRQGRERHRDAENHEAQDAALGDALHLSAGGPNPDLPRTLHIGDPS